MSFPRRRYHSVPGAAPRLGQGVPDTTPAEVRRLDAFGGIAPRLSDDETAFLDRWQEMFQDRGRGRGEALSAREEALVRMAVREAAPQLASYRDATGRKAS